MTDSQSLDLTELLSNISQDPSITDTLAYINGLEEDSTPDDSPAISIIDTLICNNQLDEVLNSLELHLLSQLSMLKSLKQYYKDLYVQRASLPQLRSFYLCFFKKRSIVL